MSTKALLCGRGRRRRYWRWLPRLGRRSSPASTPAAARRAKAAAPPAAAKRSPPADDAEERGGIDKNLATPNEVVGEQTQLQMRRLANELELR